jgi:hypothetical protein
MSACKDFHTQWSVLSGVREEDVYAERWKICISYDYMSVMDSMALMILEMGKW